MILSLAGGPTGPVVLTPLGRVGLPTFEHFSSPLVLA